MSKFTELFQGNPCALPPHLRDKKHNDWFIGKWIPRAWTAVGPRCAPDSPGYAPWPPRLVRGKGVSRWENGGSGSIIWIWELDDKEIGPEDVYGKIFPAYELNPGNPLFGQKISVLLRDPLKWPAVVTDDADGQHFTPNDYSPSALQKFTRSGWLELSPAYRAKWFIYKWREFPDLMAGIRDSGEDGVFFWRKDTRPDHVDGYYNKDRGVIKGNVSMKWE